MSQYEKYVKNYQKTPKGRYVVQKANAKRRGIAWELTFEQWWSIWESSGKWELRGKHSESYCMARKNDEGPYAVNNVVIILHKKNSRFAYQRGLQMYKEIK